MLLGSERHTGSPALLEPPPTDPPAQHVWACGPFHFLVGITMPVPSVANLTEALPCPLGHLVDMVTEC